MKFRKFMKTVPMKFYLILTAIILFAFFSNDFGLVDIQKTAIILAAGIDREEDDFLLTAQIAVPKGSDRTTGGTSSVEIETTAPTVSDCFVELFAKTGWVPKLVFCNLIVLGEEAAKEDVFSYLDYFLRNEYMPDSCLLCACEGKAKELIASQSAIDDASSLAITKLLSDASVRAGLSMVSTLKDFALDYYGVSKSGYLPFIRTEEQEGAQDASSGGSGESGGGSGGTPQKVYRADETALFSGGKMVGVLSGNETLAFSLLEGNVENGNITTADGKEPVTLTILKNGGGVDLSLSPEPTVTLSLSLQLRFCCRGSTSPVEDVSSDKVSDEELQRAKKTLEGFISSLWDNCKESGCDLFHLKRTLYRSSLKEYGIRKDTLLSDVKPKIEIELTSMH